ncbi:glycosyltransferase [Pseudomonas borbori]|uniref:Glycosyltransferase involved in cell wall bisynthesis n=1 Tax=Pseudomonas borbori TaxID=289003 RepID=A0A1I5K4H4_9PSED|nr:glycosyltransferase [Pseudomonas borbori]SFO79919.1 Glycosyltransferase involved in cell wall bisynthesis [Pseudomonas borbori]
MKRRVLFLSALDFKDKSIQVIRKTPEAYASAGWEVEYIVARDNCPSGNYYYEREINPVPIKVRRIYWPFAELRSKLARAPCLLLSKLASIVVIFRLAMQAKKVMKESSFDVVYGYELQGVLAMHLLRVANLLTGVKTISRFQGTFLNEMLRGKQYLRLLFNADLILAIRLRSDLLIMTDDGTQGDQAVKKIKKGSNARWVFLSNGVDEFEVEEDLIRGLAAKVNPENKTVLLSVSRLVGWKRVDRCLEVCSRLKGKGFTDFIYIVVGEGDQRKELERRANELGLTGLVKFVGAQPNSEVKNFLAISDFFMSMYDSSNVGNPLLEAIRSNKIVVTINNGDTGKWVRHNVNGLIYELDDGFFDKAAEDIIRLIRNKNERLEILNGVGECSRQLLWTWDQRFLAELSEISEVLKC